MCRIYLWGTLLLVPTVTLSDEYPLVSEAPSPRAYVVDLASPKYEYVVGEPVLLSIRVRSVNPRPVPVYVDALRWQISVFISYSGGPYERFDPGIRFARNFLPPIKLIDMFETKRYTLPVLYSKNYSNPARSGLAFPKPGIYKIKIQYPIFGSKSRVEIPSKPIEVRIRQPKGVDAKAWRLLNKPDLLYFVQRIEAHSSEEADRYAAELVEILETIPRSSYRDDLLSVLRRYYYGRIWSGRGEPCPKQEKLRKLLNVMSHRSLSFRFRRRPPVHAVDRRLDVRQVTLPEGTVELRTLLTQASLQTGVSLELGVRVGGGTLETWGDCLSLGQFMQMLAEPGRTMWVRDGDGYVLEHVPKDLRRQP